MPGVSARVLVTGVGAGESNIGRLVARRLLDQGVKVHVLVHHDDGRADDLRAAGAEVQSGDLTSPTVVKDALEDTDRVFFNMAVSADYLEAAAVLASLALEMPNIEAIVSMSQMTVSQMTSTSTAESRQQRLHWLVEQLLKWSGLPVITVRPTVFLDNPMFTLVARQSIPRGVLALPIGRGRTSPVASSDVADVVAVLLQAPHQHVGRIYELTGPESLGIDDLAARYGRALGKRLVGADIPQSVYSQQLSSIPSLSPHVLQHVLTVAALHREGRYDRLTNDVASITGHLAMSVEEYMAAHRGILLGEAQ